ncbi:hypothetical protein HBH70_043710 [Parastagonospora nodorum]|nr:hypothetical protein HBH50_151110 [Parastagonospora nodorum]KAH4277856.1 hypothetical protein HBI04_086460 [Parastagonospora nodorum]KAH4798332.1 hypothetical protein HBH61_246790 [Parastagonospora nodorum]KAH5049857.1 hypothetical protein HBH96_193400 [Parastagonospora nodorum]KAH5145712.1 hypothetical protein HBH70_043710 [Parastagonospora nodorum]
MGLPLESHKYGKNWGEVGNDPLAAISRRTAHAKIPNHADSCQQRLRVLEAGGWRLEAGGWRLEAGGWRLEAGGWRLGTGHMAADVPDCVAPCLGLVKVGEREAAEKEPLIGRVMMRKAGSLTTALGMSCPEKHEAWSTASDDASCPRWHSGRPMAMFIG